MSSDSIVASDNVLDYSIIGFGDFSISGLPTVEEHTNIVPTSFLQDENLEDASEEPKRENEGRKAFSASYQVNKRDSSSKQVRNRAVAYGLIDEQEDEVGDLAVEPRSCCAMNEEDKDYESRENEDDNDNVGQTYASQNGKMSKRSKKNAIESEKPIRKRKGSDNAPDCSSEKIPKKFSHSTRQKKRLQELLLLPEHEIEFQRLPCRDIILLAEHREQLLSKEAKPAKISQNNRSTKKSLSEEHSNNEDDTQGNSTMASTSILFNSHSFMDKTPRIKWSKQDTELFYEGVRQFGTDLSMIKELFPGRTRHQIKLKLKKEERQQPARLYEALSNRSKDHSYFEKVIERLQKVTAQEEEFDNDESIGDSGKEKADLCSENNDDGEKIQNESDDAAAKDEVNSGEVRSPVKCDESDDELDIWSSYVF